MRQIEAERIDVGWIDPEQVSGHFAHSIATQLRDMEYFGCAGNIHRHSASQPIVARNNLVREFLYESDSDWLWMVDADMVFDKGHVMKLWEAASEHDADIVAGLAFIWKDSKMAVPSLFYEEKSFLVLVHDKLPPSGTEIAASGLASVLVHRRVLESMIGTGRHPEYDWFDFYLNDEVGIKDSEMTGTDVQFFVRARALGAKMIVEPEAKTWHLEELVIGEDEWRKQWNVS